MKLDLVAAHLELSKLIDLVSAKSLCHLAPNSVHFIDERVLSYKPGFITTDDSVMFQHKLNARLLRFVN